MFNKDLNKFNSLEPQKETKKREKKLYNKASELYNELLKMYFDEYMNLSYFKILNLDPKYKSKTVFLDNYDYDWY